MKSEIKGGKAFSYVDIELAPAEMLITESDAMSSMDAAIEFNAALNGGFWRGLARKFLGGESLFVGQFINNTASNKRLTITQSTPGEVRSMVLRKGQEFNLQPGAFIACESTVKLGLRWAGLVSWLGKEGLFKLVVSGEGEVWYGAYGALIDKQIDGEYIVDTGHLVAYEPGIKLKLQLSGGIFSSFFGGEGLVTRVEGKGNIVLQTRSLAGLTSWINPKL